MKNEEIIGRYTTIIMRIKFLDTKEVIRKLKKAKIEKNISYDKILRLLEEKNHFLSKSTLSRVFSDGSEDKTFNLEYTLRPLASVLLDEELNIIEVYEDKNNPTETHSLKDALNAEYEDLLKEKKSTQ